MNKLALVIAVLAVGCHQANIMLRPPGTPTIGSSDKRHFDVIGFIEVSDAVDIANACPGFTAASIQEEIGLLGGVVNILTRFAPILTIYNTRVNCSR